MHIAHIYILIKNNVNFIRQKQKKHGIGQLLFTCKYIAWFKVKVGTYIIILSETQLYLWVDFLLNKFSYVVCFIYNNDDGGTGEGDDLLIDRFEAEWLNN